MTDSGYWGSTAHGTVQWHGTTIIGVKKGGCAGMEYTMSYAGAADPMDERVDDNGVSIIIDAKAVLFLLGSVIDYEISPMHSKFTFSNPNQTDACGCGESVTIVPAQAAE